MTIRGLLEKNVAERPGRNALVWCENKTWMRRTWREYLARVRDVAEGYGTRFDLKPREENVAIILGNSPTWLEAYLAQSGAGVSVVPLDPKLHSAEVEYILADSEAVVVTTDVHHLKMMMGLAPKLPKLRGIVCVDGVINEGQAIGKVKVVGFDKLRISGGGAWYDANVAREDDVASIIYTSGTTGKPKGAMLTHRNFISDIDGASALPRVQLHGELPRAALCRLRDAVCRVAQDGCARHEAAEAVGPLRGASPLREAIRQDPGGAPEFEGGEGASRDWHKGSRYAHGPAEARRQAPLHDNRRSAVPKARPRVF